MITTKLFLMLLYSTESDCLETIKDIWNITQPISLDSEPLIYNLDIMKWWHSIGGKFTDKMALDIIRPKKHNNISNFREDVYIKKISWILTMFPNLIDIKYSFLFETKKKLFIDLIHNDDIRKAQEILDKIYGYDMVKYIQKKFNILPTNITTTILYHSPNYKSFQEICHDYNVNSDDIIFIWFRYLISQSDFSFISDLVVDKGEKYLIDLIFKLTDKNLKNLSTITLANLAKIVKNDDFTLKCILINYNYEYSWFNSVVHKQIDWNRIPSFTVDLIIEFEDIYPNITNLELVYLHNNTIDLTTEVNII